VNLEDLNSDDEPIGRRLSAGVASRLKKRKEKTTLTKSRSSKAIKKKTDVGAAKGRNKTTILETKKTLKKRKVVSWTLMKLWMLLRFSLALGVSIG